MNPGSTKDEGSGAARPTDAVARDVVEALAEEYFEARRRGETPSPADFSARAGERSSDLMRLLEAAVRLEDAADHVLPRDAGTPARLGRYRILRTIGRGGMGVVCEAVDEELGRRVALKILNSDRSDDPTDVERFQREARAAARLSHPHIVQVFGADASEGRRFHVMQLVAGTSLGELLKADDGAVARPAWLDPANVARLGLDVADALAYAHAEGVLHRDIKPSNLLLDRSGCIWIADFGLAKTIEGDPITRTGDVVGTPRYLAPEALSGHADARTDVYGVGMTLYEMLARRPAFDTNDPHAILKDVLFAAPPRLLRLDPSLPRDLETIVHKCLEKEPTDRYASAFDLAADLRRFLAGEPIVARRPTLSHRTWLFARRHRDAAAIALAAGLLLVALLVTWVVTLHASNLRERGRSDALARANQEKDAALGDAFRQRGRAEANLATATAAIDRFLARLGGDEIVRDPKYQELRTAYLEDALQFLTELLVRGEDSADVSARTAVTLRRLATVERMLGRSDDAAVHAERAVTLLRGTPGQPAPQVPVAESIRASWVAGQVAQDRGEFESAKRHDRDALSFPLEEPADDETIELLLTARSQLAHLCLQGGELETARTEFTELLRRCRERVAAGRGSDEVRRNLRFAEYGVGEVARIEDRLEDARAHFEEALRVALEIGTTGPGDRWRANLVRFALGGVRAAMGEVAAGCAEQARALEDQETVANEYPAIPQIRVSLAWMRTFRGIGLHRDFDRVGARRELKRALELHEQLAVEAPHDFVRLQNRVEVAIALGAIEAEEHQESAAQGDFKDAVRWTDERSDLFDHYPSLAELRLLALSNLATVEPDSTARIESAREAIRTGERLQAATTGRTFDRTSLDRARLALAWALSSEKRWSEAEEAVRQVLRVNAGAGGNPTITAAAESHLGDIAFAREDLDEADLHFRRAVDLREQWARAQPRDAENLRRLGDDLVGLCDDARARGDAPAVRALAEQAVARMREARRLDPGLRHEVVRLAVTLTRLAGTCVVLGDPAGAAKKLDEASGLATDDAETQFECARVFAACSAAAAERAAASSADAECAERWASAAIARLGAAARAGFRDAARCEEAPEFDALVHRDDYAAALASMRADGH